MSKRSAISPVETPRAYSSRMESSRDAQTRRYSARDDAIDRMSLMRRPRLACRFCRYGSASGSRVTASVSWPHGRCSAAQARASASSMATTRRTAGLPVLPWRYWISKRIVRTSSHSRMLLVPCCGVPPRRTGAHHRCRCTICMAVSSPAGHAPERNNLAGTL